MLTGFEKTKQNKNPSFLFVWGFFPPIFYVFNTHFHFAQLLKLAEIALIFRYFQPRR